MSEIVLNYHNSLLRQSDLLLLEKGYWLNDNLIAFYFEYLERTIINKFNSRVCFINPSTSQMAKFMSYDDLIIILEGLNLSYADFAFIAVNNNHSAEDSGGSHWSLLFFDRGNKKFSHFDSFDKSNAASAELIVNSFKHIFACPDSIIIHVACPQQANCYDCGVYVISFTDYLSRSLLGTENRSIDKVITPGYVKEKRENMKELIHSLVIVVK
ncbi:hypothetical protein LOD99_5610 [Oopsacas minuta]|uniref:Ubiquitin-like protease family profile domain-containing protein n=1 Tax=Oopsacas minuta TaxID=111878 RepID=A0AAV7JQ66_9METZ|nr:hypothetical protein LOD99_5610 [Oopsacas minuta]